MQTGLRGWLAEDARHGVQTVFRHECLSDGTFVREHLAGQRFADDGISFDVQIQRTLDSFQRKDLDKVAVGADGADGEGCSALLQLHREQTAQPHVRSSLHALYLGDGLPIF